MKIRPKTLENEIYSKIIIKINSRKLSGTEISIELQKNQPTIFKQLQVLKDEKFLIEEENTKKVNNQKLYSVNFSKIIEEFMEYLNIIVKRHHIQIEAEFNKTLNDLRKTKIKDKDKLKQINKIQEYKLIDKEILSEFVELYNSKRLTKNILFQGFIETLLANYSKIYDIEKKNPLTLEKVFEEIIHTFGFENFLNMIWTEMLKINECYTANNNAKKNNEITKRYERYREYHKKDIKDIELIERVLRIEYFGFIVPNTCKMFAHEIIKENNLITKEESKDYLNYKNKIKKDSNIKFSKKEIKRLSKEYNIQESFNLD